MPSLSQHLRPLDDASTLPLYQQLQRKLREAIENRVHVHDLHATILHLLGFDHTQLTYRYAGRDFRLTDVHGHVVHEILA